MRLGRRRGIAELTGYQLYATSEVEYEAAEAWVAQASLQGLIDEAVAFYQRSGPTSADAALDKVFDRFVDVWQAEANVKTYGAAGADVKRFLSSEGVKFAMTEDEWLAFSRRASFYEIKEKAKDMGVHVVWDCEHAKTVDSVPEKQDDERLSKWLESLDPDDLGKYKM